MEGWMSREREGPCSRCLAIITAAKVVPTVGARWCPSPASGVSERQRQERGRSRVACGTAAAQPNVDDVSWKY